MPTFVDGDDGEFVAVCAECLACAPEEGSDYCVLCALNGLGDEAEDGGDSDDIR